MLFQNLDYHAVHRPSATISHVTLSDNYLEAVNLPPSCSNQKTSNVLWDFHIEDQKSHDYHQLLKESGESGLVALPRYLDHNTVESVLHSLDVINTYTAVYKDKLSNVGRFMHLTTSDPMLPCNNILRHLHPLGVGQSSVDNPMPTISPKHHSVMVLKQGCDMDGKYKIIVPYSRTFNVDAAIYNMGSYKLYCVVGPYAELLASPNVNTYVTHNLKPRLLGKFNSLVEEVAVEGLNVLQTHLMRQKLCSAFFLAPQEQAPESILDELANCCLAKTKFHGLLPHPSPRTVSCLYLANVSLNQGDYEVYGDELTFSRFLFQPNSAWQHHGFTYLGHAEKGKDVPLPSLTDLPSVVSGNDSLSQFLSTKKTARISANTLCLSDKSEIFLPPLSYSEILYNVEGDDPDDKEEKDTVPELETDDYNLINYTIKIPTTSDADFLYNTGFKKPDHKEKLKTLQGVWPFSEEEIKRVAKPPLINGGQTLTKFPVALDDIKEESASIHLPVPYRRTENFPTTPNKNIPGDYAVKVKDQVVKCNPLKVWLNQDNANLGDIGKRKNAVSVAMHAYVHQCNTFFFMSPNVVRENFLMMGMGWPYYMPNETYETLADKNVKVETKSGTPNHEFEFKSRASIKHYLLPNGRLSLLLMKRDLALYKKLDEKMTSETFTGKKVLDNTKRTLQEISEKLSGLDIVEEGFLNRICGAIKTVKECNNSETVSLILYQAIEIIIRLREHRLKVWFHYINGRILSLSARPSYVVEWCIPGLEVYKWDMDILKKHTKRNKEGHDELVNRQKDNNIIEPREETMKAWLCAYFIIYIGILFALSHCVNVVCETHH
ncbi:hypothetical protein CAPTEDRAFT_187493 [Capitella teleta]|uniref:Uncharacterized protein n=1 Tax=Capitella teleta TaxID=283909 RepID=R7TNF2_CAPTE|nr:hypothetical protein CAPTEDRAFT_187493 [Capitella teleta]|eukprot:ELT95164.1 hypothetical protein CAPTEDRAFT_187493 [Capitella teleta]